MYEGWIHHVRPLRELQPQTSRYLAWKAPGHENSLPLPAAALSGPHSSSEHIATGRAAVFPYVQLELITHLVKNHFTSTLPPSPPFFLPDSSFLMCRFFVLRKKHKDAVILNLFFHVYYQILVVLILDLFIVGW